MDKNPFQVLGLAQDIVRTLPDSVLEKMIKDNYRTLQKAYHPDVRGGSAAKSAELSEAYSLIGPDRQRGRDDLYGRYKEMFAKVTKPQLELEERARKLDRYARGITRVHTTYLMSRADSEARCSVFTARGLRISLRDLMAQDDSEKSRTHAAEKRRQLSKKRDELSAVPALIEEKRLEIEKLKQGVEVKNRKSENTIETLLEEATRHDLRGRKLLKEVEKLDVEAAECGDIAELSTEAIRLMHTASATLIEALTKRKIKMNDKGPVVCSVEWTQDTSDILKFCDGLTRMAKRLRMYKESPARELGSKIGGLSGKIRTIHVNTVKADRKRTEANAKIAKARELLAQAEKERRDLADLLIERERQLQRDIEQVEAEIRDIEMLTKESEKRLTALTAEVRESERMTRKDGLRTLTSSGGKISCGLQGGVPQRRLIGVLTEDVVVQNGGITQVLTRLGLIRSEASDVKWMHLQTGGSSQAVSEIVDNRVEVGKLNLLAPMLSPYLSVGGYLVSSDRDSQGVYFLIEGKIEEIVEG